MRWTVSGGRHDREPEERGIESAAAPAAYAPAAGDRGGRRRLGNAPVVLEFLSGDRDPRGSDPRLWSESPAVRQRPPGGQGEPADRDELLHGQAAPDGARHDDPAPRADLRRDRAGCPPPRRLGPAAHLAAVRPCPDGPAGRRRVRPVLEITRAPRS